jgi:EAL domain-containing protein (putative c-di-GMP-specific phosphodiesterase class I)
MAPRNPADELRRWSGPLNHLDDSERRLLGDFMLASGQPHIEIAEALRNNWFEVWYQPKIDLKRKCLAGAEALARIRHPAYGVLLPGSFLPQAGEEATMLLAEHALLSTLRSWSTFDAAGFNLHLAINVPVNVLLKLPISTLVRENRPKADHWPGIILEVTEDQVVRDIKQAHDIATRLRVSGITISIDDFGAGYSSFSSLKELPFAEIKVDCGFVKNCATDPANAAICQTAIDLAHRFGSAAVAEGVENPVDLQALLVMGCDFGQGVLIAPPMPQERFLGLLRQRLNKPSAQAAAPMHVDAAPEQARMAAGSLG